MSQKIPINRAACGTCPYRCDTPPGVWSPQEYQKLPEYDKETHTQPMKVFLCHCQDGSLCRGWLDTHIDQKRGHELLSIRFALLLGTIDPDELKAAMLERPRHDTHVSGTAACVFGLGGVPEPSPEAQKAMESIVKKRRRKPRSV